MVSKSGLLIISSLVMGLAATTVGQTPAGSGGAARSPQAPPLLMSVSGFADGATIPDKFTCSAQPAPVSPAVHWSQVPPGTQSFVLLLHDPEPQHGGHLDDVTHWMIWNIPASATDLPEGVPVGATLPDGSHQVNALGQVGFRGPCAPAGPQHHYTWELYALDIKLSLRETATRAQVMQAVDGHVLGKAEWIGRFARPAAAAPVR